ncbi:hypothetical protein Tsubulata_036207 [Turnera subulata]|uniref:DUF4283 domain-containing protein n=1 Tax=Turnera subulata TaxID=218843 RepID=A0A9Q0JDA2_9ROSI|nr:hypothetical protein Tsubulata_036207 [Turnera subulata]
MRDNEPIPDLITNRERVRERSPVRRTSTFNPSVQLEGSLDSLKSHELTASQEGEPMGEEDADRSTKKVRLKEPSMSQTPEAMETEATPQPAEEVETSEPQVQDSTMDEARSSHLHKLTGGQPTSQASDPWVEEVEAEVEDGDIVVVDKGGKKVVELSEAFLHRLRKPWDKAVVVKLLGRAIGFKTLQSKILSLWNPKGPIKIIDLENNYFVVRFWEEDDYHRALLDGSWSIFSHVLSVQPWSQSFRASSNSIDKVVTWVRFLDFPLDHYHSRVLSTMRNLVGKTVKLERNSENPSRGKFAKVAVAIDLTQPLEGTVSVDDVDYKVVYEGLPDICGICGRVGHLSVTCPDSTTEPPPPVMTQKPAASSSDPSAISNSSIASPRETPFTSSPVSQKESRGEWMNAPRRSRRPPKRQADCHPLPYKMPVTPQLGNKYQALDAQDPPDVALPHQDQPITNHPPQHLAFQDGPHRNPAHQKTHLKAQQKSPKPSHNSTKTTGPASSSKPSRTPLNNITNSKSQTQQQAHTGPSSSAPQPRVILRHNPDQNSFPRPLTDLPLPHKPKHLAIKLTEANHRDVLAANTAEVSQHPTPAPVHPISPASSTLPCVTPEKPPDPPFFPSSNAHTLPLDTCMPDACPDSRFDNLPTSSSPISTIRQPHKQDSQLMDIVVDTANFLSGEERKDRLGRYGSANRAFSSYVDSAKLLDLDFTGGKFTWKGGGYQAKLDRFLCNDAWRLAFPEATVFHLPYSSADHRPLIIKQGAPPPPRENRPFRFQAA